MKIEQFLEKKEQKQIDFLRQLMITNQPLTKNQLFKDSGLSKNAFEQYLNELIELGVEFNQSFRLTCNTENYLDLTFRPGVCLEQIIVYFLDSSIKYQLFYLQLMNKNLSIFDLTQKLLISESTLFRKQKELNQLLQAFHIQIKNGDLIGDETQIRYAYFELFTFIQTYANEEFLEETNELYRFVRALEQVLQIEFDTFQRPRLLCYIVIFQKRVGLPRTTQPLLQENLAKFIDDPLFQKLDTFMSIYLSYSTAELNQEESLLLYIFLTSFYLLGEEFFYTYDLVRSQKLPTPKHDIYVREKILLFYRPRRPNLSMEKRMSYQIAQANSQLFWFSGKIEVNHKRHLFETLEASIGTTLSVLLIQLLQEVLNQLKPFDNEKNDLIDYTLVHYATILTTIDYNISNPVIVGLAFDSANFLTKTQEEYLIRELSPLRQVMVKPYYLEENYDFVISNSNQLVLPPEIPLYVLSDFFTPFTIREIKSLINQYYLNKNK